MQEEIEEIREEIESIKEQLEKFNTVKIILFGLIGGIFGVIFSEIF